MNVEKNKVVSVSYVLHASGTDGEKRFIEETGDQHPLVFLFGSGQLIPAFEDQLAGLIAGNPFAFSIESENGYGPVDDEAFVRVPDDTFRVDGVLDLEVLRVGNTVPLLDSEGNQLVARIAGIEGELVLLDFNHPLAGHDLHFSGTVLEVREATEEEMAHGHVHGPGGHDH